MFYIINRIFAHTHENTNIFYTLQLQLCLEVEFKNKIMRHFA